MTGMVVALEPYGAETVGRLENAPQDLPGLGENCLVDLTPLPPGTVRQRGESLMARLGAHEFVRGGIERALEAAPGADPSPLYFRVVAAAADDLPWEWLYVQGTGFCSLDARWPVARIARRPRPVSPREFAAPLQVVAVLAAAGQPGRVQYEHLVAAVTSDDGETVGARLMVITGDPEVLDLAREDDSDRVDVMPLPPTSPALAAAIGHAQPDILHVLCHGAIDDTSVASLAFATLADFDQPPDQGGVWMALAQLFESVRQANPWLVVLNACGTADPTVGGALAHALADLGVPAVVGMRRLVDIVNADRFTQALYPSVLATVRRAVDPQGPDGARVLDWAGALTAPRAALAGASPDTEEAWGDPVLYIQQQPLQVTPTSPQRPVGTVSRVQAHIDVWEDALTAFDPATTEPEAMEEIHQRLAGLRAELAALQAQ